MGANEQELELDLERIRLLGAMRVEENHCFKNYLKGQDPEKLDTLVHKEVSQRIDCNACGNCCKHYSPPVINHDLANLSEALQIPVNEVIESYTNGVSIKGVPCTFLNGKKCTVCTLQPQIFDDFQHFKQPHFIVRTASAVNNYSICPIVFNVMEQLKLELKFKD